MKHEHKYKVLGADKITGNDRCEIVTTSSISEAGEIATSRGMYVSTVEMLNEEASVPMLGTKKTASWTEPNPYPDMPSTFSCPEDRIRSKRDLAHSSKLDLFWIIVAAILTAY